ncbi:hypothetical protein C4565_00665 [Candidatus Parcubacteria bacterium]|nr:MAG: hypothetical protein C4565_00665 [Candidatus Parcubacteria bacterium]
MSVRTAADENLDKTRASLKEALNALSELLINRCEGWERYRYQCEFREAFNYLMNANHLLRP